jgi:ribulose-5-phosphate 4-epimerase/fuculose-1-phosphate aldolase
MPTEPTRSVGGKAAWEPRVMPPIGVELTLEQKLACAFRILAAEGVSENMAGHITLARADGSLLVNPWGLWWDEVTTSDICVVTADGEFDSGRWDVTPAIHIHTELHRVRPDARVVVHNHPYHVTVLAALGILPAMFHQTGSMYEGEFALVDEYAGEIDSAALGADLARRIGDASVVILANHGIIVTDPTIEGATYKAASIDRQCRLAYDVLVAAASSGHQPTTVPESTRAAMKASLTERAAEVYWSGWVRRLLRSDPDVLL